MEPNYYAIIPARVRYDKNLTDFAKLLYAEITALSNKHGFCTASNGFLAEIYGAGERTVSENISSLSKFGFIRVEIEQHYTRKIYPLVDPLAKIRVGGSEKPLGGVSENPLHNNTSINNTSIIISADAPKKERLTYSEERGYDTTAVHRIRKRAEERMGKNFVARLKQDKQISKMLAAGYSEDQINKKWDELEEDDYWGERGFDFGTVSNEIGKATKTKKPSFKNYDKLK